MIINHYSRDLNQIELNNFFLTTKATTTFEIWVVCNMIARSQPHENIEPKI